VAIGVDAATALGGSPAARHVAVVAVDAAEMVDTTSPAACHRKTLEG
jgi:hypothetical protein